MVLGRLGAVSGLMWNGSRLGTSWSGFGENQGQDLFGMVLNQLA